MANDNKTNKQVCIKQINDWLQDTKEAMRTLREVKIMKHYEGSKHVISNINQ